MRENTRIRYRKWKNVDMETFSKDLNVYELNNIDDDLDDLLQV